MEEMIWSSSGLLGVLAANNLDFGCALWLKSAELLARDSAKRT
jgi:hypothetical protein